MLRCEVDAYFANEAASQVVSGSEAGIEEAKITAADDLVNLFSSLSVLGDAAASGSSSLWPSPSVSDNTIRVIRGGVEVPQSSLIKIKTRSTKSVKGFDWTGTYIQLLLGQTPNLFIGIHDSGAFYEVQETTLDSPKFEAASRKTQDALKKLRRLLDEIREVLMYHKTGRLSLVCKKGELSFYERESRHSFLPDAILARF